MDWAKITYRCFLFSLSASLLLACRSAPDQAANDQHKNQAWFGLQWQALLKFGGLDRVDLRPAKAVDPFIGLHGVGFFAQPPSANQMGFESGNIGKVRYYSDRKVQLALRSDNDDALPRYWRQWFYTKLDRLSTKRPSELHITGRGHWNYYVPFYSYDQKTWRPFTRAEVSQPSKHRLKIKKTFARMPVYVARYEPYTYSRLLQYLDRINRHGSVFRGNLGYSPQGRRIPFVQITERRTATLAKPQVFIHSRTHPGEVGSSFLLEGMIDFLLGPSAAARRIRQNLIVNIVPMLNVDGVVLGNNRVNARGLNLEGQWTPRAEGPPDALNEARSAPEVILMHRKFRELLRRHGQPTLALNIHASNGAPQDQVFFFPHFGAQHRGYSAGEAQLFHDQIRYIDRVRELRGPSWFNPVPEDGGRRWVRKDMPESWWWRNYGAQVMALSVEATYGYAGRSRRWMMPADLRRTGAALAEAFDSYHKLRRWPRPTAKAIAKDEWPPLPKPQWQR